MRVANRLKEELFEENREQGIESKKQKAESVRKGNPIVVILVNRRAFRRVLQAESE